MTTFQCLADGLPPLPPHRSAHIIHDQRDAEASLEEQTPWHDAKLLAGDFEERVMVLDRLVAWRNRCEQLRMQNAR